MSHDDYYTMATQVLSNDGSTVLEPCIYITLYIYNVRTIMSSVHQGGLAHNKYVVRAVASWFITLIRMHMHAGSSLDWGTVRTGPLASLLTRRSLSCLANV